MPRVKSKKPRSDQDLLVQGGLSPRGQLELPHLDSLETGSREIGSGEEPIRLLRKPRYLFVGHRLRGALWCI